MHWAKGTEDGGRERVHCSASVEDFTWRFHVCLPDCILGHRRHCARTHVHTRTHARTYGPIASTITPSTCKTFGQQTWCHGIITDCTCTMWKCCVFFKLRRQNCGHIVHRIRSNLHFCVAYFIWSLYRKSFFRRGWRSKLFIHLIHLTKEVMRQFVSKITQKVTNDFNGFFSGNIDNRPMKSSLNQNQGTLIIKPPAVT